MLHPIRRMAVHLAAQLAVSSASAPVAPPACSQTSLETGPRAGAGY